MISDKPANSSERAPKRLLHQLRSFFKPRHYNLCTLRFKKKAHDNAYAEYKREE